MGIFFTRQFQVKNDLFVNFSRLHHEFERKMAFFRKKTKSDHFGAVPPFSGGVPDPPKMDENLGWPRGQSKFSPSLFVLKNGQNSQNTPRRQDLRFFGLFGGFWGSETGSQKNPPFLPKNCHFFAF